MVGDDGGIPPLREAVDTIKRLAYSHAATTTQRAELYAACVLFLAHLHTDQERIRALRNRKKDEANNDKVCCPPLSDIPAIGAVLQDGELYRILLGMLGFKPPITPPSLLVATRQVSGGTSASGGSEPKTPAALVAPLHTSRSASKHHPQQTPSTKPIVEGRKRSVSVSTLSDAITPNAKKSKLTLSPKSAKKLSSSPHAIGASIQLAVGDDFDASVYAATVLYAALAHLDHWPAELMKAYAEDCFGPRLWVDDEACSLLVQNLALAHSSGDGSAESDTIDDKVSENAQEYAEYYTYLINSMTAEDENDDNSTSSSSGSDSGDEEECLVEVATGTFVSSTGNEHNCSNKIESAGNKMDDGTSSSSGDDSGEEEILVDEVGGGEGASANPHSMALAALSHYQGIGETATSAAAPSSTVAGVEKDKDDTSSERPLMKVADADDDSMADGSSMVSSIPPATPLPPKAEATISPVKYPCQEQNTDLDLTPVRPRYIGLSLVLAHDAIADALAQRLDAKVKQNSRLLSTLPAFISVPRVRTLSASHLERWLQSPAISGLARPLFVALVQSMKHVDPPLEEDIAAIDYILAMKLKANQLNTHIDNIKKISKALPTLAVSRHIFLQLLRQAFSELEDKALTKESSSGMTFLVSVHETLPSNLASDALAAALFDIVNDYCSEEDESSTSGSSRQVERVVHLVQIVASALGASYDGNLLVKSLLEPGNRDARSIHPCQADALARIAFECMVLMAPVLQDNERKGGYQRKLLKAQRQPSSSVGARVDSSLQVQDARDKELQMFKASSSLARKVALRWCLSTYAIIIGANQEESLTGSGSRRKKKGSAEDSLVGAGTPDYQCVLDGESPHDQCSGLNKASRRLLKVTRCLLFLASPESRELSSFLNTSDDIQMVDDEQRTRIRLCHEYGIDIDEGVLKLVLDATKGTSPAISKLTALTLMEHLFLSCRIGRNASILVKDANIAWELYGLTIYEPVIEGTAAQSDSSSSGSDVSDGDDEDDSTSARKRKRKTSPDKRDKGTSVPVPTLAYPGLWWRATSLVLAISGTDCNGVGSSMWQESSTLRAIIKMVTSGRYRFPTVDCDEVLREEMKKGEAKMREKESNITEQLFLPKSSSESKRRKQDETIYAPKGSRVSARQRAKRDILLALQREKEAALALAEAQRRRKLLRVAQKSIMIWDPRGPARKPPRESVGLILSVGELFGLSEKFRLCQEPDFLLRAIGSTSRASIERAYDWLIPIISSHPETINRLPSSASCFLLLRAYGTEGDKNKQLLELSAPLRRHVGSCISGEFGESHALKAADLLFQDMSDQMPDRRLCARRVLQEATSTMREEDELHIPDENDLSWLLHLINVKFANGIVEVAIKHISHGVAYERGGVLRSLLMSLDSFISFAHNQGLSRKYAFGGLLCELLSLRPHVCCDAMDRFVDLRDLALSVVSKIFQSYVAKSLGGLDDDDKSTDLVNLAIRRPSKGDATCALEIVRVPYHLLRASLVLVGNWPGRETIDLGNEAIRDAADLSDAKAACAYLVQSLIVPPLLKGTGMQLPGAAGAVFANEKRAVSVEQWVMLAKSRCDTIAKLAALSAPDVFLPRLLLCCGISSISLLSMIERLGEMGKASSDASKYFSQLLSPSATSEWGSGCHLGGRRTVARKLLGRISAYLQLETVGDDKIAAVKSKESSSFLSWLIEYCSVEKAKKPRAKSAAHLKGRPSIPGSSVLTQMPTMGSLSKLLLDDADKSYFEASPTTAMPFEADATPSFSIPAQRDLPSNPVSYPLLTTEAIKDAVRRNNFETFDSIVSSIIQRMEDSPDALKDIPQQASKNLLRELSVPDAPHPPIFVDFVVKWFPLLSHLGWDDSVCDVIFGRSNTNGDNALNGTALHVLMSRCAEYWNETQIRACQTWILEQIQSDDGTARCSPQRMVEFLVLTSNQPSIMRLQFAGAPLPSFAAVLSQAHAAAAVKLALECARIENEESTRTIQRYSDRNMLPDWLVLLQLVARCSKKHLVLVANSLLSRLPSDGWSGKVFPVILLRLYVSLPTMMNLGDPKMRGVLIEAAGNPVLDWLDWRCPLDDQVQQMVTTLTTSSNQRLLQAMTEMAKRQPLVLLRHLKRIAGVLVQDGTVQSNAVNYRGRTSGGTAQGVAVAKVRRGVLIKVVAVRHWGYSFSEPLWSSALEIVSALPNEVAYACGLKMGLLDIFEAYIKLIWTQHSLKCPENTVRMRSKLALLLSSFNSFDALGWAECMESRLHGLEKAGPVREIVHRCEVKVQE